MCSRDLNVTALSVRILRSSHWVSGCIVRRLDVTLNQTILELRDTTIDEYEDGRC
jgi:hypothetical protein